MNQPGIKDLVEEALMTLVGTQFIDIGRAHNLEWMIFNVVGSVDPVIEYAINIQCIWRIFGPEGIVVASDDLYYASGDDPFHDIETFDWKLPGSNRCDERTTLFKKTLDSKLLHVVSVEADSVGGVSIFLSEGYTIDLFPADSLGREYWRFFRRHHIEDHFVVTGEGVKD